MKKDPQDVTGCNRMSEASGKVNDGRMLVRFLYLLLRDKLTAGVVEQMMID